MPINLIPWREIQLQERRKQFVISNFIIIFVLFFVGIGINRYLNVRVNTMQEELASKSLRQKEFLRQQNQLTAELNNMQFRIEKIKIQQQQILALQLLEDLIKFLPSNMFFNTLTYDQTKIVVESTIMDAQANDFKHYCEQFYLQNRHVLTLLQMRPSDLRSTRCKYEVAIANKR